MTTQPTLFDQPPLSGRELRQAGIKKAADSAERANSGWLNEAFKMLEEYLEQQTAPFMVEEFREWALSKGLPQPPSNRSFGAVTQRASRLGLIFKIGLKEVTNPKAHGANAGVWVKA